MTALQHNGRGAWPRRHRRSGIVLVLVLVVVAVLTLSAYTFSMLMLSHRGAGQMVGRQVQANRLAESGVESTLLFLMQDEETQLEAGGIYDNPIVFQGVPVLTGTEASQRANFSVVAPALDEFGELAGLRFGLEDESNRLNLNALVKAEETFPGSGRDLLMALPGMTEEIADSILDWLDEDDDPRDYGVETKEYYQNLEPPYSAKNGALDTVEELLRVAGVTPQLLFGLDTNRNGVVDMGELNNPAYSASMGGTAMPLSTDASGMTGMERGWLPYLTLHSREANLDAQGQPRVHVNQDDMEVLYSELEARFNSEWATFIVAYRQNGPFDGEPDPDQQGGSGELDLSQPATTALQTMLDLIGVRVRVQFEGAEEPTVLESPFSAEILAMGSYLPTLMDGASVNPEPMIPGRLNINEAPRVLMLGIPGVSEELVDAILEARAILPDDEELQQQRQHETWLLLEGIVTLEEMKLMIPFVTGKGGVYRAQVIGYYEDGGSSSRIEAILDVTAATPVILSWRDISHLGRGYPLEVLGVQYLDGF